MVAGPFRTNAMPAGAGEVEKGCVEDLEFFLRARAALLAAVVRSILKGGVERGKYVREVGSKCSNEQALSGYSRGWPKYFKHKIEFDYLLTPT